MTFDELQMNLDLLRGKDDLTVEDVVALFKDILDGVSRAYPGGIDALELGENVKDAAKNLSAAAHGLLSMFSNNKPKIIGSTKIQTIVEDRIATFESLTEAGSFLDKMSERIAAVQDKNDELRRRVGQLESVKAEYDSELERYDSLKESVENKKKALSEADDKAKSLEEENSDLDSSLSEIKKKKEEQESENAEKKAEFEKLNSDYKKAVGERDDLLKQKKQLEEELEPLKTEVEQLRADHNKLCGERKTVDEKIEKYQKELIPEEQNLAEEGNRTLTGLNARLEELKNNKVSLDAEAAEKKAKIAEKEKECAKLQAECDSLEVDLGSKENDSDLLQEKVNRYREQLKELNDPSARSKAERLRRSCKTISDVVEKLFSGNSSILFGNIPDKKLREKQQQMNSDLADAEHKLEKLCEEYKDLRDAVEDNSHTGFTA